MSTQRERQIVPTGSGAITPGHGARLRPPRPPDVVLDEDEWTDAIEAIIERDFFPEIPKAQSKLEWIEAVRSGDPARIRQAQRNVAQRRAGLRTPMTSSRPTAADTPWLTQQRPGTAATPSLRGDDIPTAADGTAAPRQRLDAFLATHTSEDNASYQAIIARETEHKAALKAPHQPPKHLLQLTDSRPSDGFGSTGQPTMALLPPRPNPTNALHPNADAHPHLQLSAAELAARASGAPKQIRASNTRFVDPASLMPPPPEQPPAVPDAHGRMPPEAQHGNRQGYSYLDTPSMTPRAGDDAPIMTWGDIGGTPLRIVDDEDALLGDASGRRFTMPEVRARETLARRLTNKAASTPLRARPTSAAGVALRRTTAGECVTVGVWLR